MAAPDTHDVIVRLQRDNPHVVYVLGTLAHPSEIVVKTREEAVALATAFAGRQQVRAWFDNGDGTFVPLATSESST